MLVITAELGSFSACARKLGKAQSAVSQGISNLEIDFGLQLFDRSTRKPTLTPDGQRVFSYAQSVLKLTGELETVVKAIQKNEEAILRLALDNALLTPKLTTVLEQFSRAFPKTQIELSPIPTSDVVKSVTQGQADIGIMLASPTLIREIEFCFIGNIEFCAISHRDSELANYDKISIRQLVSHRQLSLRGNSGENSIHFPIISPDIWWCSNFDAIIKMVEQNLGWACVPTHMVNEAISVGKVNQFNIELDHMGWTIPVELINPKGYKKGVACQWLFEQLKSII